VKVETLSERDGPRNVPGLEALGGRGERGGLAEAKRRHQGPRPAKIAQGPGGPAEMVPGQHHVRMNMYIARVKSGSFEIVKDLGVIEPKERVLETM
jgi:hypothetical protein